MSLTSREDKTDRSRGRASLTSREDRPMDRSGAGQPHLQGEGHTDGYVWGRPASPPGRTDRWTCLGQASLTSREDRRTGLGQASLTSRESPEMTSAQSCFLRKAFSSRWASPRLVTSTKGEKGPVSMMKLQTQEML